MDSADKLQAWLDRAEHLPVPLRDFHSQKDVFLAINELMDMSSNTIAATVDPVAGHVYVVDVFLQFMARRGYTLQRSRQKLAFRDLTIDIEAATCAHAERQNKMLKAWIDQKS